ncbi:methyltransferase domain-containing protein [Pseudodesulfovibrio sp.]|uniref:class I SAM-dependent methyltransferase n=1 Tax=Pseudodesulfovibrio sp. TaxID=2035812 RepID=UPI00260C6AF5|nr:methyltransferase domain-containing protein [Pseudodesulfovibrio sp.]MDD3311830.1 methyltransferase domain-containing protein [Pseudodesulfovibrio sp.]
MAEKQNATRRDALLARIEGNASQALDFVGWIFQGLDIPDNANIVECCCGTGKQTLEFARRLTPGSRIHAFDIEQKSLDYLTGQLDEAVRDRVEARRLDFNDFEAVTAAFPDRIDLFFCSYGLYYNKDFARLLGLVRDRLSETGRITVVGPYGRNNDELFSFLQACGVGIDDYIVYTAQRFMADVVNWMSDNLKDVRSTTERNPVAWDSADKVFGYWENSTFHDPALRDAVAERLAEHFRTHDTFINCKYLMKATATMILP